MEDKPLFLLFCLTEECGEEGIQTGGHYVLLRVPVLLKQAGGYAVLDSILMKAENGKSPSSLSPYFLFA